MLGSENENFTGVFTSFIGPQVGWSTSFTISRARTTTKSVSAISWHCPKDVYTMLVI